MTPEVQIALIGAVSAVLLALVPPLTGLLFATLRKRGLEVTALEQKQVERIAREAILFVEEQARKQVNEHGPKPDPQKKLDDALAIATEEAKRARVRTPSSQTIEAQMPVVRASFLPPPDELAAALDALPPPPPVPMAERHTPPDPLRAKR